MVHWDDFRFILALHRHGTMTAASEALATNVATVSRRIERVAENLGAPVFQKEGGRWRITPLAESYVALAEEFENKLQRESNNQTSAPQQPTSIMLSAPPVLLGAVLLKRLPELVAANPNMQPTFFSKRKSEGLGDADIMLRWGKPDSGRLITRKIGAMSFGLYRSQKSTSKDWVAFDASYDGSPAAELGRIALGCDPRVRVSNLDHKVSVMRTTGMIGVLPDAMALEQPDFVRVPDLSDRTLELDIWYAYHESRKGDSALQAMLDWIIQTVRETRQTGLRVVGGSEGSQTG